MLADPAINDDLHGPARPVGTRQEHAFLDFNGIGQSREGPYFPVLQQQDDAASIGKTVGFDRGVQMKPDGKFGSATGGDRASVRRRKAVFSVEYATVSA
jgi:hypothetical protein